MQQFSAQTGVLYIILAMLGYSFLPVFLDNLTKEGFTPQQIAALRFIVATPAFWALIYLIGDRSLATRKPEHPLPLLTLFGFGVIMAVEAILSFIGFQQIPAGTYAVIFYVYPVLVAVFSLFFGERLSNWGWLALGLTFIGIILSSPNFSEGFQSGSFLGVGIALFNAFMIAWYFILSARVLKVHKAVARISAWIVTSAGIILFLFTLLTGTFAIPQTASAWLNVIALAFISTVFPFFLQNAGVEKIGASRASIVGTIEVLLMAIWGQVFLSQVILPIQWVGGALILGSVILLQLRGNIKSSSETLIIPEPSGDSL